MCILKIVPPAKKQPLNFLMVLRVILFFLLTANFSHALSQDTAASNNIRLNKKLFIYASELPKTLIDQHYVFRKHVVDVILATQKYNVVFSEIPDRLAKADVSQLIFKYKIRTNQDGKFNLEYTFIDADQVSISKQEVFEDIPMRKIFYDFRLHLYEFVLNKKLTFSDMVIFNKKSKKKILKIKKTTQVKKAPPSKFPQLGNNQEKNQKLAQNKKARNSSPPKRPNNKSAKSLSRTKDSKPGLWSLLKDEDRDSSWLTNKNGDNKKTEEEKNKENPQIIATIPFVNPFLNIGSISLKTEDEFTIGLGTDQLHIGWKFVQRKLKVKDIIELTNEFDSLIGTTFEWIVTQPIHISRYFLRVGFELDKALDTKPIEMNDHSLFRVGLGYRLPNRLLPSIYYERSSLVYANLNTIGGGLESNLHTVNWLNFELAYLGLKSYLSLHLAKSVYITKLGDIREVSSPSGIRYGVNFRYFFANKVFGLKWWGDAEMRKAIYTRENIDNELELTKNELSFRFGVHF